MGVYVPATATLNMEAFWKGELFLTKMSRDSFFPAKKISTSSFNKFGFINQILVAEYTELVHFLPDSIQQIGSLWIVTLLIEGSTKCKSKIRN